MDVNVVDTGAVGDGRTPNTEAIQSAIDAAGREGAGRVVVPPGRYLTGSLELRRGVELHVARGAVLLGSTDHADYRRHMPGAVRTIRVGRGFQALLYAEGIADVAITGGGTIDGRGDAPTFEREHVREAGLGRPRLVQFVDCRNVRLRDVRLRNGASWTCHFLACEDVLAHGVHIRAQGNYNNDGFDVESCRRVRISDCDVDAEDDAVCLKCGTDRPCEDVVVTGCVLSSFCAALKLGTESNGGFRNIAFANIAIRAPEYDTPLLRRKNVAAGIGLGSFDGAVLENVAISNVTMDDVHVPIYVLLSDRCRPAWEGGPTPEPGTVRGVSISDVLCRRAEAPGSWITGLQGRPIEDIALRNVHLFGAGGAAADDVRWDPRRNPDWRGNFGRKEWLPASGLTLHHVRGAVIDGLVTGVDAPDARPVVYAEDVEGLVLRAAGVHGPVQGPAYLAERGLRSSRIEVPPTWAGAPTATWA